jgi:glycosyltransferase involved in cell wall biosynthesis
MNGTVVARGEVIRLVWVGRMEERQKRVTDLPRIVAALRATGLAVRLDVVGDGPDRNLLENEVRSHSLDDIVRMHGWCDRAHVRTLLANSDFFLLTSNFEGMPLAIMEALSEGCSVVATITSGIEDLSRLDMAVGCLWTYPVGDVSAAVDRVRSAAQVAASERRARARQLALSEFSIDRCVDRYRDLVERFPGAQPRKPRLGTWRILASTIVSYPLARWRATRLRLGSG